MAGEKSQISALALDNGPHFHLPQGRNFKMNPLGSAFLSRDGALPLHAENEALPQT